MENNSTGKNIIIGAGISGLSCGYVLKNDCLILEKEAHIGGLARTGEFHGFRFDLGGHRFLSHDKFIKDFVQRLMGRETLIVNRKSKICRNNRLIDYPLKPWVLFHLNPCDVASSLFTYLLRRVSPLPGDSFEESARNSFGDRLFELFFKNYTEKVWGLSCGELSEELAETRLQNISLKRVLAHALSLKQGEVKSFSDTFLYPKSGIGYISHQLAGNLDVRLNAEVTGFNISGNNRIKGVIINNSRELECSKNVVSTMPITNLAKFLKPPDEIQKVLNSIRYRSLICVFLIINRQSYTSNHWIYFSDKQIFGRLHEPKNWSSYMAPKDKTGVCVEIFCNSGDSVWKMPDKELADQVIKDLPDFIKTEAQGYNVVRIEYAYPVYDIYYKKNLQALNKYLSGYKNLFLLGRTGSFKYSNMDICIEDGLKLGAALNE